MHLKKCGTTTNVKRDELRILSNSKTFLSNGVYYAHVTAAN